MGLLNVPSGRLVACDPFFVRKAIPFTRTVPAGRYPVELAWVEDVNLGRRVAMARVLLLPTMATSVEPADTDGPDTNEYVVDAGLGCFMDGDAAAELDSVFADFYRRNPAGNYYDDILDQEFRRNALSEEDVGSWNLHTLPGGHHNVAMFESGSGDGVFGSWWALGRDGQAVALFTDFRLLPGAVA